jgi:hypothetical protein
MTWTLGLEPRIRPELHFLEQLKLLRTLRSERTNAQVPADDDGHLLFDRLIDHCADEFATLPNPSNGLTVPRRLQARRRYHCYIV